MRAYCWANGVIGFGDHLPEGALPLMRGAPNVVRGRMSTHARHAYDRKTLLVPGIPEARDEASALKAYQAFIAWAVNIPSKAYSPRKAVRS